METEKSRPFVARWRDAVLSAQGPEKPLTRLVLSALSKYMTGSGKNCWPSVEMIAMDTALARRSVMRHLAEAEQAGWISVGSRGVNGQGWRRNAYTPALPNGGDSEAPRYREGGATESPRKGKGGDNDDTNVVPQSPERGATESHEQDHEQDHEQGRGAQRVRRPRTRAAQLPRSFKPDETCIAKARVLGIDADAELEKFMNHAETHGRTAKNWQAAFRNWIIKANEFGRGGSPTGRPSARRVSPSDHAIGGWD